ncbi:peptidoglycan-recognition protein 1-like [Macrosteles quadrilineatus]|uniref:peptidoglycan-recognition protein 1-like n=1 Tax=Macrosteles quadrilineatus TaxID=74068 RepID=UPI0023E09082|nr:peptidoglycan-recognition protein 1-like [Macrosteles quadrilineatus]
MPLRIVTREEWSTNPTINCQEYLKMCNKVFIQNAFTTPCLNQERCQGRVRELQQMHASNLLYQDITFNFMVGEDGNVYEGRGWTIPPCLPRRFNKLRFQSMLIGFMGDYTAETMPTQIDEATSDLIKFGVKAGHIAVDYQYYDIMYPQSVAEREERKYYNVYREPELHEEQDYA